jgi:glycosyltransferase involved in cell wall biosynthesis
MAGLDTATGGSTDSASARLRVLMIGPVPRIYGGISAVAGTIVDSDLPAVCQLTYLAEGTRRGLGAKLWRFCTALLKAIWLLLGHQADVLHLHVGDGTSFYRHLTYVVVARVAKVPILFHWHLPGDANAASRFYEAGGPIRRWLVRWALRRASLIVVLAEAWRPALSRLLPGEESGLVLERIAALPNPVDCRTVQPPQDPSLRSGPRVLFLGDFSDRKGARDLLAAAPVVLAGHPQSCFILCGGAPPHDVQVLAQPIQQAVRFPGYVGGREKLRYLQEAAVLVLPSYAEGMPVALLEGMAAGLPIVTTPVGAIPDLIGHERNGLLIEPGDITALAAGISRLLADSRLREAMGRRNRQLAVDEYDVPVYVQRLLALYQNMIFQGPHGTNQP